ncbi:GNAT family N-acetyltransferase [Bradyrhizobium prioriisuperbiae]|uniref:GNAT family N-acetyltransferase n=1 Tax=Bradyrhizobium prioriisuperbiae TaxID=2854389 RepID=UPI0028EBFB8E|nr:GNAT family N-acetyltransferase [Bradyrhizobium prioritasuperba]
MPLAAVMETDTSQGDIVANAARVAHVETFHRLADVEAVWRSMETADHLFTPFQRFDFLSAWQIHVGQREGVEPFVIVASDAQGRPLAMLPLGTRTENGVRTASFLGGKHATFNMPLLTREFAATTAKADVETLLELLRAQPRKADLLALARQPSHWQDIVNPLALLPGQPSVNGCPLLKLMPKAAPTERISNSFRRRLKSKERKLQPLPGFRYLVAQTDDEIRRILEAFFAIKPQRMAIQKLPDVFADPGVRDFIFSACLAKSAGHGHAIEIHALECDEEVIAIFAGVADGHRFSMMFNTYTTSANSKYSPGLILLRNIIDHYADRNHTSFDLGIGSDDYKLLFCKSDEPIFDSFLPLTTKGSIAALGLSSLTHAKRLVKQTPALAQMAQLLRGALHR